MAEAFSPQTPNHIILGAPIDFPRDLYAATESAPPQAESNISDAEAELKFALIEQRVGQPQAAPFLEDRHERTRLNRFRLDTADLDRLFEGAQRHSLIGHTAVRDAQGQRLWTEPSPTPASPEEREALAKKKEAQKARVTERVLGECRKFLGQATDDRDKFERRVRYHDDLEPTERVALFRRGLLAERPDPYVAQPFRRLVVGLLNSQLRGGGTRDEYLRFFIDTVQYGSPERVDRLIDLIRSNEVRREKSWGRQLILLDAERRRLGLPDLNPVRDIDYPDRTPDGRPLPPERSERLFKTTRAVGKAGVAQAREALHRATTKQSD